VNRPIIGIALGIGVFLVWYFVALDVLWARDGMGVALGASLGLNAALLYWIATAPRASNAALDKVASTT
jgi:hypothetical protein